MWGRQAAWAFAATVWLASAPAGAQLSVADVRCRAALAKGVLKLAGTVVKERARCHKSRMNGQLGAWVACNDSEQAPFSLAIDNALSRLASATEGCAESSTPGDNPFVACPPPCDAILLDGYDGVAPCLSCVSGSELDAALVLAYGTPPVLAAREASTCQNTIGRALQRYLVTRLTAQRKCQTMQDADPDGSDCRSADAEGKIGVALAKLSAALSTCTAQELDHLDSCATTPADLLICIRAAAEQAGDTLFDAVYHPFVPAPPSPTPTATPSPSAQSDTPTETPAATATISPTRTPTTGITSLNATLYRPQSEYYGQPFQRRAVADAGEASVGGGVRINGDNDDGDGSADFVDAVVGNENDLVELVLQANVSPAPAGYEYVIRRTNPVFKVWQNASKGTAILGANDEQVVELGTGTISLWVEASAAGSGMIQLEARAVDGGPVLLADQVRVYTFTSIVMALGGEGQGTSDPPNSNYGTFNIALNLYQMGYDVHMYDEDDVGSDGGGPVYDEVVRAIQRRDVHAVAIFGYSHGGGSTYDLAERLNNNRAGIGTFTLPYSAYIDGIMNSSDIDIRSEDRLPPATQYHVNYYQRNDFFIKGDDVPGANVNINVGGGISHGEIDDQAGVRSGVQDALVAHVNP